MGKGRVKKKGKSIQANESVGGQIKKEIFEMSATIEKRQVKREERRVKALFASPQHPYSQALIASTPRLTGGGIGEGIEGRIPEYLNPPPGCRFNPRCKFVMSVCREKKPPLFSVGGSHEVACFLYENQGAVN